MPCIGLLSLIIRSTAWYAKTEHRTHVHHRGNSPAATADAKTKITDQIFMLSPLTVNVSVLYDFPFVALDVDNIGLVSPVSNAAATVIRMAATALRRMMVRQCFPDEPLTRVPGEFHPYHIYVCPCVYVAIFRFYPPKPLYGLCKRDMQLSVVSSFPMASWQINCRVISFRLHVNSFPFVV